MKAGRQRISLRTISDHLSLNSRIKIFFIKKSKALSARLKHVFISPNLRMYYFENVMNIVENIWSK